MRKLANSPRITRMVPFLLAIVLDGCSLGPAERSAPHTYLLTPEISFKNTAANPAGTAGATLLVSPPRAQPGFDTARMAYLLRPHEVSYYVLNQWADAPGRMLMRLLVQTIERTHLWRAVVQAPSPVLADYRLDCDNLVLEQQFFSHPSRVRLALRGQLIDVKRQSVMGTRDFETFEAAPSDDAYGGVIAANRATATLLQQLAVWLSTVMSDSEPQAK
jgi:cholesterol transport system auxiliary component